MAETITIEGRPYLKRNPLGVLGLSFVTLGIYFFYWYWKVNDELSTFEHDDSISPTRSLVAITLGWVVFVPPFIAMYNTAKPVQNDERRLQSQPELEPAITIALLVLVSIVNGLYIQDHVNRIWERSVGTAPARPDGSTG